MNDLQIGKMYCVKEYFWLLLETKEMAALAGWRCGSSGCGNAYEDAKWFGELYKCNVAVVEKNTCFVLLEQDEKFFKLLDSNGNIGWIRCYEFSKCFELAKE